MENLLGRKWLGRFGGERSESVNRPCAPLYAPSGEGTHEDVVDTILPRYRIVGNQSSGIEIDEL